MLLLRNKYLAAALIFVALMFWFFVYVTQLVTSELVDPIVITDQKTEVLFSK